MLVESTIESEMNYHFTNDLDFKESRLEKPPPIEYDEKGEDVLQHIPHWSWVISVQIPSISYQTIQTSMNVTNYLKSEKNKKELKKEVHSLVIIYTYGRREPHLVLECSTDRNLYHEDR